MTGAPFLKTMFTISNCVPMRGPESKPWDAAGDLFMDNLLEPYRYLTLSITFGKTVPAATKLPRIRIQATNLRFTRYR